MAEAVIAANALLAAVYAFNSPTYRSIVREMIDGDRIGMYNSVSNGGGEIVKIAGPMAAMLLVRWIGVRGALLFDALTFLLSAASEMLLVPISETQKKTREKKNIFRDIAGGFAYLVRERQLLFLILLSALVNFFLAGFNLLCPYTDVMYASFGIEFYSKVLIMEAAGGLFGSLISSRLGSRVKENARIMILFLGAMGASLALEPLAALTGSAAVCLVPFLLSGTALTVFNIQFMSYVQLRADEAYLGRVFSIIFTVAVLFMPVGSFVFSFLLDTSSPAGFAVVGGGIILLAAAGLAAFRKKE